MFAPPAILRWFSANLLQNEKTPRKIWRKPLVPNNLQQISCYTKCLTNNKKNSVSRKVLWNKELGKIFQKTFVQYWLLKNFWYNVDIRNREERKRERKWTLSKLPTTLPLSSRMAKSLLLFRMARLLRIPWRFDIFRKWSEKHLYSVDE